MIDRIELEAHFARLRESEYFDEALGDAALAIELVATGHGDELMRTGAAWMAASGVVWKFELEEFVERVKAARRRGLHATELSTAWP